VFVASSTRVTNVQPALIRPQLFWRPESVAAAGGPPADGPRPGQ
jgi:hypothetical protein